MGTWMGDVDGWMVCWVGQVHQRQLVCKLHGGEETNRLYRNGQNDSGE